MFFSEKVANSLQSQSSSGAYSSSTCKYKWDKSRLLDLNNSLFIFPSLLFSSSYFLLFSSPTRRVAMSSRTYAVSTTVDRPASSMETKVVRSQCSARVRTSARYHGYGAYFTFLWHNSFYNVLPDPSLGLGRDY